MEKIKHKIMVMSNKGGVGKSTVAINLAYGLSERGKKVGILDADLHGPSLAMMSGSKGEILSDGSGKIIPFEINQSLKIISLALLFKDQDNPIIWRGPLKMKAIKQFVEDVEWGELDYLIIDSPPGTGDEPLSLIQLVANLDGVVIVTTPQGVALLDSRKAVNFVKELNVPVLGIVENMSGFICPHCGTESELFKKGGGEKAGRHDRCEPEAPSRQTRVNESRDGMDADGPGDGEDNQGLHPGRRRDAFLVALKDRPAGDDIQ